MYLLYADESGHVGDAKQQFFVLAGFRVFERQGYWIAKELDEIAARFNPAEPSDVELHGNPMNSGKGIFRKFPKEERMAAMEDALRVFMASHPSNRLFGSVIKKEKISPADSVEFAFEQLSSRFDHYLTRLHKMFLLASPSRVSLKVKIRMCFSGPLSQKKWERGVGLKQKLHC